MEMQGQTVVVTGGASGIGKATALLLAREGARVFIGDVDEAGGQAAAAEAAAERLAIEYLPLDLTDAPSIEAFAAAVHQRTERVDGWSTVPAGTRSSRFSKIRPRSGTHRSRST